MLLQHREDAPAGVIETVGAETRVDRPRASREDLTEMEEEMILELKSPGRTLFPFARALLQSSSIAHRHCANYVGLHILCVTMLQWQPAEDRKVSARVNERLPKTAEIVRLNRKGGPERVIDEVEKLAPAGFEFVDRVLSHAEREAIVKGYAVKAGFTQSQVNK